jgi:hypothetical protein
LPVRLHLCGQAGAVDDSGEEADMETLAKTDIQIQMDVLRELNERRSPQ